MKMQSQQCSNNKYWREMGSVKWQHVTADYTYTRLHLHGFILLVKTVTKQLSLFDNYINYLIIKSTKSTLPTRQNLFLLLQRKHYSIYINSIQVKM